MALPSELMGHSMVAPLARDLGTSDIQILSDAELRNALTKGQNYVIYTPITLTANITLTGELTFLKGGSIITNGHTLTINGPLVAGPYRIFTSGAGEVVLSGSSVDKVLPEWWGALQDGVTDCTTAINYAIAATRGIVGFRVGTYKHTGITLTNSVTLQGEGWKTILSNSSAVNHSISRTGAGTAETRGIKIADLALEHTGGGSTVDGIHMEDLSSFLRIERVYVLGAPRHGIYIQGSEDTNEGGLYSFIEQCYLEGNGGSGCFIEGGVNNATIIGGRFGGNVAYGLKIDDTTTPTPNSYPNTIRVYSTDLPGNDIGLYEGGHSNLYVGIRFEGNDTADIHYANKSQGAIFIYPSFSSSPVITGAPAARPTILGGEFKIRQYDDYGYLEYYDELLGGIRKAPKRSVYNIFIAATLAGSGTVDWPIASLQDRLKIKTVKIIPATAITGANTNYMRLALRVNKTAGAGDVLIAHTDYTLGNNAAALTGTALTISGNENRIDGDAIYLEKTEFGTGMATPNLAIQVEYGGY